jgi:hypothetical protein
VIDCSSLSLLLRECSWGHKRPTISHSVTRWSYPAVPRLLVCFRVEPKELVLLGLLSELVRVVD